MTYTHLILFDMDGVLLNAKGYHKSLQKSVQLAGKALGMPSVDITEDHIAKFEALNITNEWDSIAICAALIMLHVWQYDPNVRLDRSFQINPTISSDPVDFDYFLDNFRLTGDLPGKSALSWIQQNTSELDKSQMDHLVAILENCRDIFVSLTLPIHQEMVLGSQLFNQTYHLAPQLQTESYLSKFDQATMLPSVRKGLLDWLRAEEHTAGILTNRPSLTPSPTFSSPEAELGAEIAGIDHLPILGSGMLSWFAETHCGLPGHTFLKPNPVHSLALMQKCYGLTSEQSLRLSLDLWLGKDEPEEWDKFHQSKIIVFEDSIKGLMSAKNAQKLLADIGIMIELVLIGVGNNPIKTKKFLGLADQIISDINEMNWANL